MARVRYVPNHSRSSGIGGYIQSDAGLRAAIYAVAHEGRAYAESIAPVQTGAYRAAFDVIVDSAEDRISYFIVNDSDHAAEVEYDRTHTLAKTADYLNAKSR